MRFSEINAFLALLLVISTGSAYASNTGPGLVGDINATSNYDYYFKADRTRTTLPACVTNTRWDIASSTTQGQAQFALVLSAKLSGRRVVVEGPGTCPAGGDSETINNLKLVEP